MKKAFSQVIFALAIIPAFVIFQSCSKKDSMIQETIVEQKSEILSVEKELGLSLFKHNKTISDGNGNSVTLLIASKRASVVQDYLDNMDIELQVVDKADVSTLADTKSNPNPSESNSQDPAISGVEGLMLEVVSKSFGTDTKAFKLHFRGRTSVGVNLRDAWEFESTLFIEGFKLEYHRLNCPTKCTGDLIVEHWSRMCAFCRFRIHSTTTLSPGHGFFSCNDARRTLVKFSGDSPRTAYVFTFTFLNCA